MLAIVFESVEKVEVRELESPNIQEPTDVIVEVQSAGLCGSDLHPFFGRELGLDPGTVMGHEMVGVVRAAGRAVSSVREGDRVCVPFTTNCGACYYCQAGLTSRCVGGQLFGWRQNASGLHGCQSQQVLVPLADSTLMKVPDQMSSDLALLLGDNLSTGCFCAEMAGVQPDGVYAVVGCGNVGLLAIASARWMGAERIVAFDPEPARCELASSLGAAAFTDQAEAKSHLMEQTDGRGADAVMELVGLPKAQQLAYEFVRPGGVLSVIGCHCTPNFSFSPGAAYDKNLTYKTGRCPARHYMDKLVQPVLDDALKLDWCVTHRFAIEDGVEAYDLFAHRRDGCIKAVIDF